MIQIKFTMSKTQWSLGDIHQICSTYYPNVKIKKVKATLLSL
jgi:hypothetical protein